METTSNGIIAIIAAGIFVVGLAIVLLVFVSSFVRGITGKTASRPTSSPRRSSTHPPTPSIFISYRRDDSAGYAGRLYDRLRGHFVKERLFMDIDNIPPGHDFVDVLDHAIASCNVVLALIGKQWLSITDADGARRLDNPHDFVRLEVATALRRNIRVIPVLLRGATMPPVSDLPADLQGVVRRQAFVINDDGFHRDVDRLIEAINTAD